jgi:nicotinamidase-related amidase
LQNRLQQWRVPRVVICGAQSEFCADTTTRRAMALGYPVQLVSDGHSTLDNGVLTTVQIAQHHNVTLSNIESFGPRTSLVTATDLRFDA